MSSTCAYCEKVINNGTYGTKEEMLEKLDVFLLNNRITQEEYNELSELLNPVTTDNNTLSTESNTNNYMNVKGATS
ncbi:hypothetical protein [uncultured Clostridium sp.]|uniref:hypothetical protein n=1 Tax=uncultured Clostridium sp. TaxID=59620 RepID=UPI0028E34575|nr:hypothetical protein [uncultured Clostridium sp.]